MAYETIVFVFLEQFCCTCTMMCGTYVGQSEIKRTLMDKVQNP